MMNTKFKLIERGICILIGGSCGISFLFTNDTNQLIIWGVFFILWRISFLPDRNV
jgi:hypothetical protein